MFQLIEFVRWAQSFDELLLLKRGGRTIYFGPTGDRSAELVNYFEGIRGVPRIEDGINPATWMLEVSHPRRLILSAHAPWNELSGK